MRTREEIAVDVLECALSWEPGARLVGNVTAAELVALSAASVLTCPKCGSEAWVNIDCYLCSIVRTPGDSK